MLDDKVLFQRHRMPTCHMAYIVDDHLMIMTHVIRGEDWLPSFALHRLLYQAFGWDAPKFAHLPLIMKPVGKGKLSKRDGEKGGFPVFPLSWNESTGYREAGFFPEAVVNFLALLGWNPGTEQEIFSLDELVQIFSLERVNKSGARFDPEKNNWYNQQWLQRKTDDELAEVFIKDIQERQLNVDLPKVKSVVSLIKERAVFVSDFWNLSDYFFQRPTSYEEKAVKKQWKEDTPQIMEEVSEVLSGITAFESSNIETIVKEWISHNELSFGKVMPPLRLIIVGDMKGPHLFDILELIGKEESIQRIKTAITTLSN